MGRGRGKGKKQSAIAARDDAGSGEEEKIPTYKRRGRPNKPLKYEFEEVEEAEKIEEEEEEEDGVTTKSTVANKDVKNENGAENGRKRKKSSKVKENLDFIKEENGVAIKNGDDDSIKPVGFRQNGSRRKSTPRRAAEVGVGCK